MSRCWGCCQENCGYGSCSCSCHNDPIVQSSLATPRNPAKETQMKKTESKIKRRNAGLPIDKGYTLETVLESMNQLLAGHGLEIIIVADAGETLYVTIEKMAEDLHLR